MNAMMEDIRNSITCKVCFRLLYEPFTIACGHTYCYSCLNEWFDRNEDRRKTCPDCRAVVKQPPAPAYTIKGITQIYLQHPEHLPEGETKAQHEELAAQEQAIVDVDKSNTEAGGLFRGVFNGNNRPAPILDDGIERCPFCTWELEPGDGPLCPRCGQEHDVDSDDVSEPYTVTDTSEGGGHHHHHDHPELDEEVDEDDMYDDEVFAALQNGPLGLGEGGPYDDDFHGAGNEPYYISSGGDSENESVRIIGARQRAQQRQAQQPHIHHHHHHHHHIHGSHSPVPSDMAEFSPVGSDTEDRWTLQRRGRPIIIEDEDDESGDSEGNDHEDRLGRWTIPGQRRHRGARIGPNGSDHEDRPGRWTIEEEDDESGDSEDDEETDSIGSLRDFLADEEEGRSERGSSSASNSMDEEEELEEEDRAIDNSNAGEESVAPFSDEASLQSGYSANSTVIPELTPHQRRAYQDAMSRHIQRNQRVRRPWDDEDPEAVEDLLQDMRDDGLHYRNEEEMVDDLFGAYTDEETDILSRLHGTDRGSEDPEGYWTADANALRRMDEEGEDEDDEDEDEDEDDSEDEAPIRRVR